MNCDACVGVEAEHHQCDQCVQDDIAAERTLRAELTNAKAKLARQRAEIRRLRKALTEIAEMPARSIDGQWQHRRHAVVALSPKRRARK